MSCRCPKWLPGGSLLHLKGCSVSQHATEHRREPTVPNWLVVQFWAFHPHTETQCANWGIQGSSVWVNGSPDSCSRSIQSLWNGRRRAEWDPAVRRHANNVQNKTPYICKHLTKLRFLRFPVGECKQDCLHCARVKSNIAVHQPAQTQAILFKEKSALLSADCRAP